MDTERENYDDPEVPVRLPPRTLAALLALAGISVGFALIALVRLLTPSVG